MIRLALPLLLAAVPALLPAQNAGYPSVEFVESVPLETSLDDPAIRNTLPVWLELIGSARHTLDIEQFYISPKAGEALDTVLAGIRTAAARGVQVRVLVDSRMHRTYPEAPEELGRSANITVRVLDFGRAAGGIQHAKSFVVDRHTAFLGSQNFDWRALTHIRELGLVLRDTALAGAYSRIFAADWDLAGGADPAAVGVSLRATERSAVRTFVVGEADTAAVRATSSPPPLIGDTAAWDLPRMLDIIAGARRELYLQFLSYTVAARDGSRWTVLDDALRNAADRGVDVRLVVADWSKAGRAEASLLSLARHPGVKVRYSVIPEWSGGYVSYARVEHCKYILADGSQFWLGTSNAEKSYFHTSRNLGVIVRSPLLGARLRTFFLRGWESPYGEPLLPGRTYTPRKHDGD